jgi:hypothetical protein
MADVSIPGARGCGATMMTLAVLVAAEKSGRGLTIQVANVDILICALTVAQFMDAGESYIMDSEDTRRAARAGVRVQLCIVQRQEVQ